MTTLAAPSDTTDTLPQPADIPPSLDAAKVHAREVVDQSKTSFGMGMRILGRPRREAMYAIYAFCREIDDIADEEGPTREEKHAALTAWRAEIDALYDGTPTRPTAFALCEPIARYNLDKQEFILLIEGMEMDVDGPVVAPSRERLMAYCRRVAGAVGMLSMPVFGAPPGKASDDFALALADALQITNILRDVQTDADIGRLYLPRELLEEHGVLKPDEQPDVKAAAAHPAIRQVCRELGSFARQRFADARRAMAQMDWRVLRPALLMMGMYEVTLSRLEARDFSQDGEPVKLSKAEKLMIALRYAFAPPLDPAE